MVRSLADGPNVLHQVGDRGVADHELPVEVARPRLQRGRERAVASERGRTRLGGIVGIVHISGGGVRCPFPGGSTPPASAQLATRRHTVGRQYSRQTASDAVAKQCLTCRLAGSLPLCVVLVAEHLMDGRSGGCDEEPLSSSRPAPGSGLADELSVESVESGPTYCM